MNYQQTIDYLFNRLPMFSRIGAAAIKKDLTNTILLCQYLDHPENKFKSVHIAGTNGKGSTSHMLAAVLQTAGFKTGLYTSPHLRDFRERIRINGKMIDEQFVIRFTEQIKPMIEQIEPSFFEITVAMAFDYFAKEHIDIAIVEVGLGGRLDSTNVIIPELSVITNIGRDHMNLLGDTVQQIAAEKAGIIKNGIPVVIGETSPETKNIFEDYASANHSPIFFADRLRYASDFNYKAHHLTVDITKSENDERITYELDLPAFYQVKNLITVLETIRQLRLKNWDVREEHVHHGLKRVKLLTGLYGRWQIMHQHPIIVFDVGHNEDGIRQIVAQIELTDHKFLHIIIGMVKDKEIDNILSFLPREAVYYFTRAQIPRALPEDQLFQKGVVAGLRGNHYPDINTALKAAISHAQKEDLIVVCGSVYIIGEIDEGILMSC